MMLLYVCLIAIGHVSFGKTLLKDIPFKVCQRSDKELNSCLMQQVGPFLKMLKNGIPELGVESIDPYKIDFATAEGDSEFVKIKMAMKNISLTGGSDTTFNYIKFDPISQTGDISFRIPYMRMICDYFASGRLFVLPLESSAHFDGNFTGIDMTGAFRFNTITKRGKEYYTIHKIALKMRVETAKIKLISIDPVNQQQVNLIQDFFNENDRLVLDTVNPIVNEHTSEFSKHIVERVLRRIPVEDLISK